MIRITLTSAAVFGATLLALALPAAEEKEPAAKPDREEAKKAFEYLNKVRQAPGKFGKELGIDLGDVKPRRALVWNDTLAKVAEEKALDMAKREYFDHVTPDGLGINIQIHEAGYKLPAAWVKDKKSNYFESIAAGNATGVGAIRGLLVDEGDPNLGHRKQLLGLTEFQAGFKDIGIGFARAPKSKYRTYMSVVTARRR